MTEQDYRVEELGLPRESILQEAQRIIHGDRNRNYGHPRENFKNIADLWTAYKGVEFTSMDVGLMMILLKVARLESGDYHRDSVTDISGYAGTLERIFEEPVVKYGDTIPVVDLDEPVSSEPSGPYGPLAQREIELLEASQKPEPRVWDSLNDIPKGVKVYDSYGDFWRIGKSGWLEVKFADDGTKGKWADDTAHRLSGAPLTLWDCFAPFTEVVA